MNGTNGCGATNSSTNQDKLLPFEKKTPGNPTLNYYGLRFDIDYDIVKKGATYQYNYGKAREAHGLGGSRSGYGLFGELILDFSFKDGRTFHQVLNLRDLMATMLQKYDIYDLGETKFGGSTDLLIRIDQMRLTIDYSVDETKRKDPHFLWGFRQYPIFEKNFAASLSKDAAATKDGQQWEIIPGSPDLSLYGISFVLDKDYFVSGTYRYSPEGNKVMPILGGGRYGYQSAGELSLDFTLKNGRRVQQRIDLRLLLQKLQKNTAMIDLSAGKLGGYTDFVVRIEKNNLAVDYRLLERRKKTKLSEMTWEETYQLKKDRPKINYRLLQDLIADSTQYMGHIYPLFVRKFDIDSGE